MIMESISIFTKILAMRHVKIILGKICKTINAGQTILNNKHMSSTKHEIKSICSSDRSLVVVVSNIIKR